MNEKSVTPTNDIIFNSNALHSALKTYERVKYETEVQRKRIDANLVKAIDKVTKARRDVALQLIESWNNKHSYIDYHILLNPDWHDAFFDYKHIAFAKLGMYVERDSIANGQQVLSFCGIRGVNDAGIERLENGINEILPFVHRHEVDRLAWFDCMGGVRLKTDGRTVFNICENNINRDVSEHAHNYSRLIDSYPTLKEALYRVAGLHVAYECRRASADRVLNFYLDEKNGVLATLKNMKISEQEAVSLANLMLMEDTP